MFTDCPSCHRQFRLHARQLSAARGWVQCGYCGEQFNALERLHDQPQPRPRVSVPVIDEEADDQELPSFDISDEPAQSELPEPDLDIVEEEEPVTKSRYRVLWESKVSAVEKEAAGEDTVEEEVVEEEAGEKQAFEVRRPPIGLPPQLQQEEPPRRSRFSRVLWGLAVVLLLVITAAQVAWFNRDDLLTRYPQFMPLARRVCEYFQCSVIRHQDVSAIKLLNRDVRDHPRYKGALLVNATIANESDVIQPFPVVQLALFDTSGKLIGERKFRPDEYLDQSIDSNGGMPPKKPFHIVLEVTGPTQGAVSFEFHFLED